MDQIPDISTDFSDVTIGNNPVKINIVCSRTAAACGVQIQHNYIISV